MRKDAFSPAKYHIAVFQDALINFYCFTNIKKKSQGVKILNIKY